MIQSKKITLIPLFLIILTSCSEVVYSPVSSEDKSSGFRFYNSSPYLLVYANGKGGVTTQLLYIADPYKKMSALPKGRLSKINTTLEFDKGVYKKGKDELDGTSFPKAVVDAIKTIAPALIAAALNAPTDDKGVPAPLLYKIVINGNQVKLVGGSTDSQIQILSSSTTTK